MTLQEFVTFYKEIEKSIADNSILDSIRRLALICGKMNLARFKAQCDDLEITYQYLLQYFAQSVSDPERTSVIEGIKNKLVAVNDGVFSEVVLKKQLYPLYGRVEGISYGDIKNLISNLTHNEDVTTAKKRIFEYIVFNFDATPQDDTYVGNLMNDDSVPVETKSLIASALFLSMMLIFRKNRYEILCSVYMDKDMPLALRERVLIGLFLLSFIHATRINASNELQSACRELSFVTGFEQDMAEIIMQFMKCRNTERLNRKVEKDIMPTLLKISPDLMKMKKSKNFDMDEIIEQNPEWQNLMENSDVASKLHDISEMQFDGADIFMNTFSQMHRHTYFSKLENWFIPYCDSNPDITERIDGELLKAMANTDFLSDTDKYALTFSMAGVDAGLRDMLISSFRDQEAYMNDASIGDVDSHNVRRKLVIRNVMRDLYRFFSFVGFDKIYGNPFSSLPFAHSNILCDIIADKLQLVNKCGDYLIKYDIYDEAIAIYDSQINAGIADAHLFQKAGYCHQKTGNYAQAIACFERCEYMNNQSDWLLLHLAQCYRHEGELDKALDYYEKLNSRKHDNLSVILNIGHIYLDKSDIEQALKYYYQALFVSDGAVKAVRPIAWCEFLAGRFEKSASYYNRIPEADRNANDWLNVAHLNFVTQNIADALSCYSKALHAFSDDASTFRKEYFADASVLEDKGLSRESISLMADKVCYDAMHGND